MQGKRSRDTGITLAARRPPRSRERHRGALCRRPDSTENGNCREVPVDEPACATKRHWLTSPPSPPDGRHVAPAGRRASRLNC